MREFALRFVVTAVWVWLMLVKTSATTTTTNASTTTNTTTTTARIPTTTTNTTAATANTTTNTIVTDIITANTTTNTTATPVKITTATLFDNTSANTTATTAIITTTATTSNITATNTSTTTTARVAAIITHTWGNSSNETYIPLHMVGSWHDPGTLCTDQYGELYPVSKSIRGDLNALGTSVIRYECAGIVLERPVIVRNVFELNGASSPVYAFSDSYWLDPWATCIDDSGTFVTVTSDHDASLPSSMPIYWSSEAFLVYTIHYSCFGFVQSPPRVVTFRNRHFLVGPSVQYLRVCYPDDDQCNLWTDPGSDCYNFEAQQAVTTSKNPLVSSLHRSSPNTAIITYSNCPFASDLTRTIYIREPIVLYGGLSVRARTGGGFWIDPGGDCIDAVGNFFNLTYITTVSIPNTTNISDMPLSVQIPGIYSIAYSCPAPTSDVVRQVEVRDGLVLNGPAWQFFIEGETWVNPKATCINDEGDYMTPVDGNSDTLSLASAGTQTVTYSCRRRATPDKTRHVVVYVAFELIGKAREIVRLDINASFEDKGAICRHYGAVEVHYTSERRRFVRDTQRIETMDYSCNTNAGLVTLTRTIEIRLPFRVLDYIRQNDHTPQRVRTGYGMWVDPGAECIDDEGEIVDNITASHVGISLSSPLSFRVTYDCRRRATPDVYRDVEIRDALILLGATTMKTRTKAENWADPGADCINYWGLQEIPSSTHTPSGGSTTPGTAFSLATSNIYTITYSCSSAPDSVVFDVQRTVTVRDAIVIQGGIDAQGTIHVWSNPGVDWTYEANPANPLPEADCIHDDGHYLDVIRYVDDFREGTFTLDSPGKSGESIHEVIYTCDDTPNVTRLVHVRDAIRVLGSDPIEFVVEGEFSAPSENADPGVDAIDENGNDITNTIQASYTSPDGNPCSTTCTGATPLLSCATLGTYTVTFSAALTASAPYASTQTREVQVTRAIKMAGANPKYLLQANMFGAPSAFTEDAGVSCRDLDSNPVTAVADPDPSTIDRSVVAENTIVYTCTHLSETVSITRTIYVVHPITLNGTNPMKLRFSSGTWVDPGYRCIEPSPMDSDNIVNLTTVVTINNDDGFISLENVGMTTVTYRCRNIADDMELTVTRIVDIVSPFTLFGSDPDVKVRTLTTGAQWTDPGAECLSETGQILSWSNDLSGTLSLRTTSETLVTYTCSDGSTITRRVVVTPEPGTANTIVRAANPVGTATTIILVGETYTDPGACCVDAVPHLLSSPLVSNLNNLDNSRPGPNTIVYRCDGLSGAVTYVDRVVRVNNAPVVSLYGETTTRVTPGSDYIDSGAWCYDTEDGMISMKGQGQLGEITNGHWLTIVRTGCLGLTSGKPESVFDGDWGNGTNRNNDPIFYGATDKDSVCPSCLKATLLWLDFGVSRQVAKIHLKGVKFSSNINTFLGDVVTSDPSSIQGKSCKVYTSTPIDQDDLTLNCEPRQVVGRILTIKGASNDEFTLCEVMVQGRPGPTAPPEFIVHATPALCTGITTGLYRARSVETDEGIIYNHYNGSAWGVETIKREVTSVTDAKWTLRDGSNALQAEAAGLALYPPMEGWAFVGTGDCTGIALQFEPGDMCTWLFGHTGSTDYECSDGSTCSAEGCCVSAGDTKRCHETNKYMCEGMCSGDYCCVDWETGSPYPCGSMGGPRRCKQAQLNATLIEDLTYTDDIGPRIETVSVVNTSVIGEHKVFFTCVDSVGAVNAIARTVLVACEAPVDNSNVAACGSTVASPSPAADYDACEQYCLDDVTCEAYTFDSVSGCQLKSGGCGGYDNSVQFDKAAICRRTDKPPTVILGTSTDTANQGIAWVGEGSCSCSDLEDFPPPTCTNDTNYDINVAGIYTITYTCTDTASNVATATRQLIVKAYCPQPVANHTHADGFCKHTGPNAVAYKGAPVMRGAKCVLQCEGDFQPNFEEVVCTSTSDTSYESHLALAENGPEEIPKCGSSTCNEPEVANAKSVGTLETPCVESQQNYNDGNQGLIVEYQFCTPNCLDGYMSTLPTGVTQLECVGGSFVPVTTFFCYKQSTIPLSLVSGTQYYVTMDIRWYGGTAHDCVFNGWQVQGRRLSGRLGKAGDGTVIEDYHDLSGCSAADTLPGGRAKLTCTATGLFEGGTYDLRVRETCTTEMLNSNWFEVPSQAYTLGYIYAPEILLASPTGTGTDGVLQSPGQVILAISVSVEKGTGDNIILEREAADYCTGEFFTTLPQDVVDGQPENNQVGLINGRIFLVLPRVGFFQPGCDYKMTFGNGSMLTQKPVPSAPQKENGLMEWRFTYIDERPVLSLLSQVAEEITQTGIKTTLALRYHLASLLSCVISRKTGDTLSDPVTKANLDQYTDDYIINFEIDDQLPDSEYSVTCDGHKAGKEHVLVEAHNAYVYTTMKDTNVDFIPMVISKYATCPNGTEFLTVPSNTKTAEQLKLGEVLLIRSYEKTCNNEQLLLVGDNAIMKLGIVVEAWSSYARVDWGIYDGNGPNLTFSFTKTDSDGQGNESSLLTSTAIFYVCPHANIAEPDAYPCKKYELVVVCVDLVLEIEAGGIAQVRRLGADGNEKLMGRSLTSQFILEAGPTPGTQHLNLTMGMGMTLKIVTSDSVVDWDFVEIGIGSTQDAYKQIYTYDSSTSTVTIASVQGVGIYFPLIFDFQGVKFDMKLYISFQTPDFAVTKFKNQLLTQSVVTATFTTGMTFTDAQVYANAIPEVYLALKVVKEGYDHQLCGGTQFDRTAPNTAGFSVTDANIAKCSCSLAPAILTPLVVKILLKNYTSGDWWVSTEKESLPDDVGFLGPDLTGMRTLDTDGNDVTVQAGYVTLDTVSAFDVAGNRQVQQIKINGANFPDLSTVQKEDAAIDGYQLYILPADGAMINATDSAPEVPACYTITYVSTTQLICNMVECLDVRFFELQPKVILQLGDLRSKKQANMIRLPRPFVQNYAPKETYDVGEFTFAFVGTHFGYPCNTTPTNDPLCAGACAEWVTAGRPGTSAVQMFANTTVLAGNAPCQVSLQNDTQVICTSSTSLRAQRKAVQPGEIVGKIQEALQIAVTFTVGSSLTPSSSMPIATTLMHCQVGEQRVREDGAECEKCIAGQYSHSSSAQWPLLCSWCDSGSFNDQPGMTGCSACPANTVSGLPPDSIERCTCTTGYYSQYLDDMKIYGLPGKACVSCSSADITDEAPSGKRCGQDYVNVPLCNVPTTHVCAPPDANSYSYRYCQVSCSGGMRWPVAKPGYFITGELKLSQDNDTGQYKPVIVECDPDISCLAGNVCFAGYAGFGCVECQGPPLKPYYREKLTNLCQPCGEGQVIGTIIMAAVGVILSVGAFVGSLLYMKVFCDPVFRNQVEGIAKERVAKPLMKIVRQTGLSDLNKRRTRITFSKRDLLPARSWITKKDLGMVIRVSPEDKRVYVAGVRDNTPAYASGIRANWRLVLINSENVKAITEEEVKSQIAVAKIPITLTFRAPPSKDTVDHEAEDAAAGASEGASTAASGMRMLTMSLGVAQSFKGIMSLEMDWPPFFSKVAYIVQNMLLNFDFFHPECSVAAPYWQKWLGFAMLPYGMFLPLFCSASALRLMHAVVQERFRKDQEYATIQDWMLTNAMCRTMLITMLVFVNFHFTSLIQPFSCIEREPDVYVLAEDQSTECSVDNEQYRIVFLFSCFGWMMVFGGFAFLMTNLWKGYYWQVGVDVRDRLPWWMAMLEASTDAMKGYKEEVRDRIYSNIVAVKMFPVHNELMKFREQLSTAIHDLGNRSRRVKAEADADQQGIDVDDTMDRRRDIIIAKDRFNRSLKLSGDLDGNVLTYGWVLMVNTLARQLALMLCVVFSAQFPPFGAAGQSLVFIVNFLMIASNQPYMSELLNFQEAMLVACMAALTFMATFKELLAQHQRAPDYPQTIAACAILIDILVLCIVCIIVSVMVLNFGLLAYRAIATEDSSAMLNRVHYERMLTFEKGEQRMQDLQAKRELVEARDQNFGSILLMDLKQLEYQCKPHQWPQFRQGANVLLHLFNQTLAQEKEDENPLNDDRIEAFGLRPTTQHLGRRKGSGIFTDILSKCLMEQAATFAEKDAEQSMKNAPFKGLAAMLIAWIERDVGQQRMRSKLKSKKARLRGRARKIAELAVTQLIDRVVKNGDRTTARTLDDLAESDEAYAGWDLTGQDYGMVQDSLWSSVGGFLGENNFANWDALGPVMDTEFDPTRGFANWWDDVGPIGWDGTFADDYDYDYDYDYDAYGWGDLGPAVLSDPHAYPSDFDPSINDFGPNVLGPAMDELGPAQWDELGPTQWDDLGPAQWDELGPSQADLGPAPVTQSVAQSSHSSRKSIRKSTRKSTRHKHPSNEASTRHAVEQPSYVGTDFTDWGDLGPSLEELGPAPDNPHNAGGDSFELGQMYNVGQQVDDASGFGWGGIGPGLDDLGPGLDDLGPSSGWDGLGPTLDNLGGATLDDLGGGLGPALDNLGPTLYDLGPSLSELGPGLDDMGLDMLGPSADMLGPEAAAPSQGIGRPKFASLPPLPMQGKPAGRISASAGSSGVATGFGAPMSQPRLGNDLGLIPEEASPKARTKHLKPKAKPIQRYLS